MINLKEIVEYNPNTGVFIRKDLNNRIIGTPDKDGYLKSRIKFQDFRLHRLAWFLTYDKWPKNQIDHINRIKNDNRLCNLREAKPHENLANRILNNNKFNYIGVNYDKRKTHKNYMARIMVFNPLSNQRKRKHLGYYATAQEASEVYDLWAQMTQGEFYYG
jgi:hypothetical protein